MEGMTLQRRIALADRLRVVRTAVAADVTERFLAQHPDWLERWGERARLRGIEDAGYHLDFLAGALEAGSTEAYRYYARWTAATLRARCIAEHFLA